MTGSTAAALPAYPRRQEELVAEQLSAYYRVTPGGNGKPRPPWFSRQRALRSFLAACAQAGGPVDLVFVADGGVPDELAALVAASGPVLPVRGGSAAKSFRRLLDVATARETGDALVWCAEDDYLYRPEALTGVLAAARALPDADLFGVYTPDNADWHRRHVSQPGGRPTEQRLDVGGQAWRRTWDSTSTFGLRAGALRADAWLLRLCSRAGGPWDHACVTALQGIRPYPVGALHRDLFLRWSRASAGRVVSRPLIRAAVDAAATTRRPRTWVAPVVDLATHAEPGYVSAGTDWEALAAAYG